MDTQRVERVLERANQVFGFIPNLFLEVSANPAVADLLLRGLGSLSRGALTPAEQQVVMLAVSAWNECHYCTAAHRAISKRMGVADVDLDRLDRIELPTDERLETLVDTTWTVIRKQGWLDAGDQACLRERGIDRAELYEIIAFVGLMTITNYVNHVHGTELDERWMSDATRPSPETHVSELGASGRPAHRGVKVTGPETDRPRESPGESNGTADGSTDPPRSPSPAR